jgi:hypothetical protein
MKTTKHITVSVEVPVHLYDAFNETVRAFLVNARGGLTAAQKAADLRAADRDSGIDSLAHLMHVAEHDSGQSAIVARFLAGLYNSTAFPFALNGMRVLDADLFEHCISVLRLDKHPINAIENYFPDGDVRFQRMLTERNILPRLDMSSVPKPGQQYNANYFTYSTAPGYRSYSLFVTLDNMAGRSDPIELYFSPEDSAMIAKDILDIHRFAWQKSSLREPVDRRPGEMPPHWIGTR